MNQVNEVNEVRAILASTRSMFGAAACSCALTSTDGASLKFVAADGAGADAIIGVSIPVNRGIAGWVALSGQPTAIADVARDDRFARDVAEATDYVPSTIVAVPLVDAAGEVIGVVEVLDPARVDEACFSGQRGTGAELAVLSVVASQLAAVLRLSDTLEQVGAADGALVSLIAAVPAHQVPLVRALILAVIENGR